MLAPLLLTAFLVALVGSSPSSRRKSSAGMDDFNCRSSSQPFPVILLHGLWQNGADLRGMQDFLAQRGFCTFAPTYGANPDNPSSGGVRSIPDSSKELSDYIDLVADRTGAEKVDLVGHSEGGLMALYVPKFHPSTRKLVRKSFAIAPPTHGTTLSQIVTLFRLSGTAPPVEDFLITSGCPACVDMQIGKEVIKSLEEGGITQSGIKYTVLTSKHDKIVTPVPDASYVREDGVRNLSIQDFCPFDPVGHLSEGKDRNVWNLVLNELQDQQDRKFRCSLGFPLKRDPKLDTRPLSSSS